MGGIPVNETSFATDTLNPVQVSYIPQLLSTDFKQPVTWTKPERLDASPKLGIYMCDGETDSDLEVELRKFVQSTSFYVVAAPGGLRNISPSSLTYLERRQSFYRGSGMIWL